MSDLFDTIENAVQESLDDPGTTTDTPDDPSPTETPEVAPEAAEAPVETEAVSPEKPTEAQDEFAKKFGIPAESHPGRENRIPYSRVKKIVEKAVRDKETELAGSHTPKLAEFETKLKDYETKVTDYEGRLGQVAEFEQVMLNQPDRFLQMLATVPAYKEFFEFVQNAAQGHTPTQGGQAQTDSDPKPQPDEKLADGTLVYSDDGLTALLDWKARQMESSVVKKLEARYKGIEDEWTSRETTRKLMPKVQAQIDAARKWQGFDQWEPEITALLQKDQSLSLEGAYRIVRDGKVNEEMTQLKADRNKMREELIAEMRNAPKSSSLPQRSAKPGAQPNSNEARSTEDIIRAEMEKAGLTI